MVLVGEGEGTSTGSRVGMTIAADSCAGKTVSGSRVNPVAAAAMVLVGEGEGTPMLPKHGSPVGMIIAADSCAGKNVSGSRWIWADALRPDPLHTAFTRSTDCCAIRWDARRGRHVMTVRDVQRGELLMTVQAAAVVSDYEQAAAILTQACAPDGASPPIDLERLGLDASVVALALSLLQSEAHVDDIASSLLTHRESLCATDFDAVRRIAHRLRSAVSRPPLSSSSNDASSSDAAHVAESDDRVARLLLAVKSNAHAVLDDLSASRTIGLGLYPPACLLNHSCSPTASLCFSSRGKLLHVRALCDLKRGQEVRYFRSIDREGCKAMHTPPDADHPCHLLMECSTRHTTSSLAP